MLRSALLGCLALWLAACRTPGPDRERVERILAEQAACWNRGDLRGFVTPYWDDPNRTFVGSAGLRRGLDDVLAGYERGYPDAASRGTLEFDLLEVRPLGCGRSLVIGTFHLVRPERGDDRGIFSLIVAEHGDGLRIEHDHSSATAPPASE